MSYNQNGQWDNSFDPSIQEHITSSYVPGAWSERTANGTDTGYQLSPGYNKNVYNGPGGAFTQGKTGSWSDSTGRQINDLSGYLGMKKQQASGSDFSGYQAGVNTALNDQGNWDSMYGDLIRDPSKIQQTAGYQFALDQGNQAINRSAAAKGMLNSGNVLAELAKYGQGMASQEYDKQLGRVQAGSTMANARVNSLGGLMKNAQQFGVQSGYFPGQVQNQTNQVNAKMQPSTYSTTSVDPNSWYANV